MNMIKPIPVTIAIIVGFFLIDDCSKLEEKASSEKPKMELREQSKSKKLPLLITSDEWSLQINNLNAASKDLKELGCYFISGESEIAGSYSTGTTPEGEAPVMSLVEAGEGDAKSLILGRTKIQKEYHVFTVLEIQIKNNTDKNLTLKLNDIELRSEDDFHENPHAFKIGDEIFKLPEEENYAIIFPPQKQYGMEFLFVIPERLANVKMAFPTFEEQYLTITQIEDNNK